jgi:hypothetical protein
MKIVVTDYVWHFHDNITELPSEVIIAVITLGTTITGLMTYILKGLFNPK